MASVIDWVMANKAVILGVLLAISEVLALVPGIKANSIFTLLFGWLKKEQPPQV